MTRPCECGHSAAIHLGLFNDCLAMTGAGRCQCMKFAVERPRVTHKGCCMIAPCACDGVGMCNEHIDAMLDVHPLDQTADAAWNAALEWVAGWIEAGYQMPGDTADPHAIAMTARAGRKPLVWSVMLDVMDMGEHAMPEVIVSAPDADTARELAEAKWHAEHTGTVRDAQVELRGAA